MNEKELISNIVARMKSLVPVYKDIRVGLDEEGYIIIKINDKWEQERYYREFINNIFKALKEEAYRLIFIFPEEEPFYKVRKWYPVHTIQVNSKRSNVIMPKSFFDIYNTKTKAI
jgi:hypothetical protein